VLHEHGPEEALFPGPGEGEEACVPRPQQGWPATRQDSSGRLLHWEKSRPVIPRHALWSCSTASPGASLSAGQEPPGHEVLPPPGPPLTQRTNVGLPPERDISAQASGPEQWIAAGLTTAAPKHTREAYPLGEPSPDAVRVCGWAAPSQRMSQPWACAEQSNLAALHVSSWSPQSTPVATGFRKEACEQAAHPVQVTWLPAASAVPSTVVVPVCGAAGSRGPQARPVRSTGVGSCETG
jgi:hypothetical protein